MKYAPLLIAIVFTLVGCSQAEDALPTLMPTALPPTEVTSTEAAPEIVATPIPIERPTLPPTWTPSPVPTETPIPPTPTTPLVLTPVPTLIACGTFDIDRENSASTITIGQPVQVFWTPVDGAMRYRIFLLDERGFEVHVDYSVDPTFTFTPDLFRAGRRYAWEVYPEDNLARQMCIQIAGELAPAG